MKVKTLLHANGVLCLMIMMMNMMQAAGPFRQSDARLAPKLLNYQGYLADTLGNPVTNPSISMTFGVWSLSAGGSQIWFETQNVSISKGIFNVLLGNITPIPDTVFTKSTDRWLELTVGGITLAPRTRIASAGYAYTAVYSDTAVYARLLQGKDTVALDARFVNEGQVNSVSTPMIIDTAVTMAKIARAGASGNQVIKWNGAAWQPATDMVGADADWNYLVSDVADTTLQMGGRWGLVRPGNTLYGNADSTHVNLGVSNTTGTSGMNYKYCTVAGGRLNIAGHTYATVSGGYSNAAESTYAAVSGGYNNTAGFHYAVVGGGYANNASGYYAAINGGRSNFASDTCAFVGGGKNNKARGPYSVVSGGGGMLMADSNLASGFYTVIGGGRRNIASNYNATVSGGFGNVASGGSATVGGGNQNSASGTMATVAGGYRASAIGEYAFAGGGYLNIANGYHSGVVSGYNNKAGDSLIDTAAVVCGGWDNSAVGKFAFVGGGVADTAIGRWTTVSGGWKNIASGDASTIAGGSHNTASQSYAVVGGGYYNDASNVEATVGGGYNNVASGYIATVAGGDYNYANGGHAAVGGGYNNYASGGYAAVGGGSNNLASGNGATVAGGNSCTSAADYSFTVGNSSTVTDVYTNSAAFNGQTATSTSQTRVGVLSKVGGSFTIDHPLDPENKILNHYFVESPEMSNIYEGEAVLDGSGRAEVILPDYFDALNRSPRIQLTGVGTSDVYVAEKVKNNRFVIGGKPGTDVYWMVTGSRKDPSAEITRILMPVEQVKDGGLTGRSLDDEFLVTTMSQLERMGKASGFSFRHASEKNRYEEMKQMLEENKSR